MECERVSCRRRAHAVPPTFPLPVLPWAGLMPGVGGCGCACSPVLMASGWVSSGAWAGVPGTASSLEGKETTCKIYVG